MAIKGSTRLFSCKSLGLLFRVRNSDKIAISNALQTVA